MAKNQDDSVNWCLRKAEEYLQSAQDNIRAGRLFPAAEEIFRSVETVLEALLRLRGIEKVEYPSTGKKFTGRLALQFLIRDNLVRKGIIERAVYDKYLSLATELHMFGYMPNKTFSLEELRETLRFAEDMIVKAKTLAVRDRRF
jgi:uncharacterized protein (UPF0332 family)